MYGVPTADSGDLAARRDAVGHGHGRAGAVARRRALAAGHPLVRRRPSGAQGAPGGTAVSTDSVSEAHLGRVLAMQRRRQLSQGKEALNGDGDGTAAAAGGAPVFVVHRGGVR